MNKKLVTTDYNLSGITSLLVVKSVDILSQQGYEILSCYGSHDNKTVKIVFPDGITKKCLDTDPNIVKYQVPTYINE